MLHLIVVVETLYTSSLCRDCIAHGLNLLDHVYDKMRTPAAHCMYAGYMFDSLCVLHLLYLLRNC